MYAYLSPSLRAYSSAQTCPLRVFEEYDTASETMVFCRWASETRYGFAHQRHQSKWTAKQSDGDLATEIRSEADKQEIDVDILTSIDWKQLPVGVYSAVLLEQLNENHYYKFLEVYITVKKPQPSLSNLYGWLAQSDRYVDVTIATGRLSLLSKMCE